MAGLADGGDDVVKMSRPPAVGRTSHPPRLHQRDVIGAKGYGTE